MMFPSPPARFEKHVINHSEVYWEVARRRGLLSRLAHKSTYNPRTKKYFAFADSFVPVAANYLKDYWTKIGYAFGPTRYEDLRMGAQKIRRMFGVPCGLGLAPELDSNIALHSLLWSFGGSVQDEDSRVTINSNRTVTALKYAKALYQESGSPEVFGWKPGSNDRAILRGNFSWTMNAISISRRAERERPEISGRIMVSEAPRGPLGWLACPHVTSCYVIWQFAENKEGARQFLVDLADNLGAVFKASRFCSFPLFPTTVPDLKLQLERDPNADPHHKYLVLKDALFWTTNIGHPGYATAAIDEVFNTFVLPRMFAAVAKGELTAENAAAAAEREVKRIFEKWENV
jgi:multiple sugar transport system substrate-binding protein